MARRAIECPVLVDDRPVRSETLLADTGPYGLAIATTLPDLAIALHSAYLGHPDAEETHVAHLMLSPGGRAEIEPRTVSHDALPVAYTRRACLYDHLQQLQDVLAADAGNVQMQELDAAVAAVDA